jgi:hypothetical protein
MTRAFHHPRTRRWRTAALVLGLVTAAALMPVASVAADEPTDMVLDWNINAIAAIGNPPTAATPGLGQPPPLAPIHLAMVHGAIYDAVNAIDGGFEPYLDGLPSAPSGASKAAAVATAAAHVLLALPPGSVAVTDSVNGLYAASLAEIDPGPAKDAGIAIGAAAAAAMIAEREDDGRFGSLAFTVGVGAGEWQLVPPLSNNVFGWIAEVEPFTLKDAGQFRTRGPLNLHSREYAREFDEVKALGAQTGSTRTEAQTSLAGFVSSNPLPWMNRGLREIAVARGLSMTEQAQLFARTTFSSADSAIGCWDNKVHWSNWRPQTAIELAADDGNRWTTAQPGWRSLISTPGYPDVPSGFNCIAAGIWNAAREYFGTDDVSFQLTSPGVPAGPGVVVPLPGSTRSYTRLTGVVDDAIEGRMLNGLHFRHANEQGAWLGEDVAQWVDKHYFEPAD